MQPTFQTCLPLPGGLKNGEDKYRKTKTKQRQNKRKKKVPTQSIVLIIHFQKQTNNANKPNQTNSKHQSRTYVPQFRIRQQQQQNTVAKKRKRTPQQHQQRFVSFRLVGCRRKVALYWMILMILRCRTVR